MTMFRRADERQASNAAAAAAAAAATAVAPDAEVEVVGATQAAEVVPE